MFGVIRQHVNIVSYKIVPFICLFLKCLFTYFDTRIGQMYKSGNSTVGISKLYILDGCFEYESRNSSGLQIILTLAVTSYKMSVSVFEETEIHFIDITYHSVSCFGRLSGK